MRRAGGQNSSVISPEKPRLLDSSKPVRTMRAWAELGREAKASFRCPLLKERTRGRETGLVGFLNSKPSYKRDIGVNSSHKRAFWAFHPARFSRADLGQVLFVVAQRRGSRGGGRLLAEYPVAVRVLSLGGRAEALQLDLDSRTEGQQLETSHTDAALHPHHTVSYRPHRFRLKA